MPTIHRLVKAKGESVLVHFLDHPPLVLRDIDVLKHSLAVGKDLPQKIIDKLKKDTQKHNFFEKALNFISYRPRSISETHLRLQKLGATPSQIKDTITKLLHYDYLNDQRFATWLIESRLKRKSHSPALIKSELFRHHIDSSLIDSLLSPHLSSTSQLDLATQALEKKFKSLPEKLDLKLRQRLLSFLVRRGFSFDTASSAIDEISRLK